MEDIPKLYQGYNLNYTEESLEDSDNKDKHKKNPMINIKIEMLDKNFVRNNNLSPISIEDLHIMLDYYNRLNDNDMKNLIQERIDYLKTYGSDNHLDFESKYYKYK